MKKLHFDYYMQIDYSEPVSTCNYTIKCIPVKNNRQIPHNLTIELSPPSQYRLGVDGLKNQQLYGRNSLPHKMFSYRISGDVDVGLSVFDEVENEDLSMIFKHPHGMTIPGPCIKAYFEKLNLNVQKDDNFVKAVYVMNRLHEDYDYIPNTTTIETTAEEAFSQGHGVCQDFAHIFISLMHLAGIPARYVTGLIVGEGASHAWVEILHDKKWYGLDPTNNMMVLDEHIKIGVGRDTHDCMINRGIMHGGGSHTQLIKVSVDKLN